MSRDSMEPDHEHTPEDAALADSDLNEARELETEQFDVDHTVDVDGDDVPHDRDGARLPDDADWDGPTEDDEFHRMSAWLNRRAGRFLQTAEELRQTLAGEASARAAIESLGKRVPVDDVPGADLTAAAFFDVDNTLVHGASIVLFARGLASRKYFSYGDIASFAWQQAKFRVTGKENAADVAQGKDKALSFIAGRETAELVELGEDIYDEFIADKIWPGTAALAQRHLDAGQQVWLVTATPVELRRRSPSASA